MAKIKIRLGAVRGNENLAVLDTVDIVPGSTLRYGSSFWMQTGTPRLLRDPPEWAAVVMPFPTELTTPPVTKIYFGIPPREPLREGSRCT